MQLYSHCNHGKQHGSQVYVSIDDDEDDVLQHGGHTLPNTGQVMQSFTVYIYDIGSPCYGQLTTSK